MPDGQFLDKILPIVYLVGSLQGFVLATALLLRRPCLLSNRLMAAFVAVFSIDMLFMFLMNVLDYHRHTGLLVVSDPLPFLYGPLIYLYTRSLTTGQTRLRPRDLLHAVPCLAHYVSLLPMLLASPGAKIAYWEQVIGLHCDAGVRFWGTLVIMMALGYLVMVQWLLWHHARVIRERFSTLERMTLGWLRFLAGVVLGLWFVSFVVYVLVQNGVAVGERYGVTYIGATLLIYAIGWMGLRQPALLGVEPNEPVAAGTIRKYEKARLSDEQAEDIATRLLALMASAAPWRRNGLTLVELAAELGEPSHRVSQVLNDRLGANFHDFVNEYRVREVTTRLVDPAQEHLTLLSLALDAGFSSKSTFNSIFKKFTGKTPSAWRREQGRGPD
jgi:AraC-like DNA-binding protein